MEKDDLGFAEIQRIFAKRDQEQSQQSINPHQTMNIIELPYEKIEVQSNPEYENMHVKNIKITKKGKETAKLPLAIMAGVVVVGIAAGIYHYIISNQNTTQVPTPPPGIVQMDKKEDNIINSSECDLSNFTIILREGTSNVNKIVDTTEKELSNFGVNFVTISDNDDISNTINNLKIDEPHRDIIVINVDGYVNKTDYESVVMTNYSNNVKSADVLAIAMQQSGEYTYNLSSDIRCGKKDPSSGERTRTSVEETLYEEGYSDVVCLTIAPNESVLSDEVSCNNLSTVIAESVIRFAYLDQQHRYSDLVRRVEAGDTISQLAVDNDVSEMYIRSTNYQTLDSYNGNLRYNTALIVAPIPDAITTQYSVNNPSITEDPMDIKTETGYYTVQANDTLSEIAENLNVSQSSIVVPSGNPNIINVGDTLAYEKESDLILVHKARGIVK